jgi:hypothetical protein
MDGKALFATVRDGQPGLRELPGGPLTVAQPSRVDDVRAARFDAYRARIGWPPTPTMTMRRPGREPGAWRSLNAAATAYRERATAARATAARATAARAAAADPAAADIARRGRAAVADALRHRRTRDTC